MKMSNHFLLLLILLGISSLEADLGEKDAIEIQIGIPIEYDKEKNYFKFTKTEQGDSYIVFKFMKDRPETYLIDQNNQKKKIESDEHEYYYTKIENTGTYYIETKCHSIFCEIGDKFSIAIFGNYTEIIDFNRNYYYQPISLTYLSIYLGDIRYKVTNLKEDITIVFKNFQSIGGYFPYDPENPLKPGTPYPDASKVTIFEVLDINENKSYKNLKIFNFKKKHEYIMTIRCFKRYDFYQEINEFIYSNFLFFPIKNSNIKKITGEEGFFISDEIIYGVVNSNNTKEFYLYVEEMEGTLIYYSKTEENIDDIFSNSDKFFKLIFGNDNYIHFNKEDKQNIVFFILPNHYGSKIKLYLADEIIRDYRPSYNIPANSAKIINLKEIGKKDLILNYILTYKSEYKNMRITFSNENESTDYIIQNYLSLPIFVKSDKDKDCTITTSYYSPKFAFFGAENPYLFNTFFNYVINAENINLNNYVNLTQMNLRINSKYLPWYEFYNFYLNQLDVKLNIFIRQLYGGSEIYECNADDFNQKILDNLMTPISNVKCKNKKSLLNRLWTLDGTKIISGYLSPDSYFDVYVEIKNDQNTVINLSPFMIEALHYNNSAKYLKKDIKYTLNFELDHLIKLEPGFNAEIEITNGQQTYKLNSQNQTATISGHSFTIKSNNDAMVYFLGKISNGYSQKLIDFENNKGKIVKISNCSEGLIMDFGFENYYPSIIPMENRVRSDKIVYLDNIYDKLKIKLVQNEKFYIYGREEDLNQLKIEYIEKNINNPNNDYNIFLIPGNNEDNTLIINTHNLTDVYEDLVFCQKDTTIKLSYTFSENESYIILTDSNYTNEKRVFPLFRGDNKLTFKTNKQVIFTYSFYDETDKIYNNERDYYLRSVLDELKIEEIVNKNNKDNIIKIKFNANYKQSSTRYIIIIAQKNNVNTLDNFKDPCFIVDSLNKKPQGVLIDVIYDIGESSPIEAEVDISNILHDSNNYVMNIISQELRFEKRIRFYEPKEFTHTGKEVPSDSTDKSDINDKENNEDGIKGSSLALAIITPVLSIIIIILIIIITINKKRKGSFSADIEGLAPLNKLS